MERSPHQPPGRLIQPRNGMQHLGRTRSSYQRDHLLHTPDTFVRAPTARHAERHSHRARRPRHGRGIYAIYRRTGTRRQLPVGPGSELRLCARRRCRFRGESSVARTNMRGCRRITQSASTASEPARVAVIEKPHSAWNGIVPGPINRRRATRPREALLGDEAVEVRMLLPDDRPSTAPSTP